MAAAARSLEWSNRPWATGSSFIGRKVEGRSGKHQVTAEQMEISRLRAELARVTMERDILEKRRHTLQRARSEVCLHRASSASLADLCAMQGATCQRVRFSPTPGTARGYCKRRHLGDEALLVHISAVYAENRGAYGGRASGVNSGAGIRVGKLRVQRLMQKQALRPAQA